jgi:transposase InsO family protein
MIDSINNKTRAGIRMICDVLDIPRSSYYTAAKETPTATRDRELTPIITRIFNEHRRRYGYRRISSDLDDLGITCAPARVRRLMATNRLRALQPKSFTPKTSDGRADAPSPNLIAEEAPPTSPRRALAGDITHIPIAAGWVYLAVVIDLCTRQIVGWSLADNMRAGLVTAALGQAIETTRVTPGLIFHSDRGSQYGSQVFRKQLFGISARQSMSRRANPYDNAWTESVIGTIKRELIQDGSFENIDDARAAIFDYIDGYYNTRRKHSSIGYITPNQYEKKLKQLALN